MTSTAVDPKTQSDSSPARYCWDGGGRPPLTRGQFAGVLADPEQMSQDHSSAPSFADLLFPKAALGEHLILMKDLCSAGRLFEVMPVHTEGRPLEVMQEVHQRLVPLLRDVFPQDEHAPWMAQFLLYDQHNLSDFFRTLEQYIEPGIRDTTYTQHWLGVLRQHFQDATEEHGFFFDPSSDTVWKGRIRRLRLCVWRIQDTRAQSGQDLDSLCTRLTQSLAQVGVQLVPQGAVDWCNWLSGWFGPQGLEASGSLASVPASPLALLAGGASGDLAHSVLSQGAPQSSAETGNWYFHGRANRYLTVNALLREPQVGHLTAERLIADRQQSLWDRMPVGTAWSMVMVFAAQDRILEHVARVKRNSVGNDPQAIAIRALADEALQQVSEGNPILPVFSGAFVSAADEASLETQTTRVIAHLMAQGIAPILPKDDPLAQDSYIRALPFNFDPAQDEQFYVRRSRLWFIDHIVRCLPLYGRSIGTQHPGILAWNRGAEPFSFDPLNPKDRTKNAHMLVFGPTGSGKTAFLVNTLLHMVAVHRPRLYLVTALPTFGLLARHFEAQGLSVHHVDGDRTSIPPFADADQLLQPQEQGAELDSGRDLLGEMEIQARLMITGGDPKEEARLAREDLNLIRKSLLAMARSCHEHGKPVRTEHLARQMHQAVASKRLGGSPISAEQCQNLSRMANALELFCSGRAGQVFNREGETWPESDVTVVELGPLAHRRNEAWLAVAMTSLLSRINDQVQAQQYTHRQTIVVLDEAHLLLKNALIAPYILSISAMWRTYGAWLWIATQNLRQIPDTARELLNQPEWWVCMSMERDEVDMIARFRQLSAEQKSMLLSAHKEPGKYTEGVVMSSKLMTLFRNVVPSLSLALSQTEKNEKAHRAEVMQRHQCSEMEAVHRISEEIRRQRLTRKAT